MTTWSSTWCAPWSCPMWRSMPPQWPASPGDCRAGCVSLAAADFRHDGGNSSPHGAVVDDADGTESVLVEPLEGDRPRAAAGVLLDLQQAACLQPLEHRRQVLRVGDVVALRAPRCGVLGAAARVREALLADVQRLEAERPLDEVVHRSSWDLPRGPRRRHRPGPWRYACLTSSRTAICRTAASITCGSTPKF